MSGFAAKHASAFKIFRLLMMLLLPVIVELPSMSTTHRPGSLAIFTATLRCISARCSAFVARFAGLLFWVSKAGLMVIGRWRDKFLYCILYFVEEREKPIRACITLSVLTDRLMSAFVQITNAALAALAA